MDPSRRHTRTVAIVGLPNTGKSTFFNRITGASARVANWPGITVDSTTARIILGDAMVRSSTFRASTRCTGPAKTRRWRSSFSADRARRARAVVNATRSTGSWRWRCVEGARHPHGAARQHAGRGTPPGHRDRRERLEAELDTPVVMMSAKHGAGIDEARRVLMERLHSARETRAHRRRCSRGTTRRRAPDELLRPHGHALPRNLSDGLTDRIDRVLLHPRFGSAARSCCRCSLVFQAVYRLGAPLQDGVAWLLDHARDDVPRRGSTHCGRPRRSFVLEGIVDGVGTVLSFLPHHRPVLRLHGLRRGLGLPVTRGVSDGRADVAAGARRPRLRDAADGLRLQRPGAHGHAGHALAGGCGCSRC